MKQQPDISIVTINYNGLQETEQLIESLQQNPQKCSYEVIVVDNGSVQNEAKILQAKYPYIQSIRSERNLGFSGGNNLGICVAKGKCIFLLNNDTLVSDDSLVYLYETLMSSSDIGAVSPKIKFAFPPRNIQFAGFTPLSKYTLRNRAIGYNEPDKGQFDVPKATHFLHGAAMIVKREVIENIGLMPEIYFLYYEELDWSVRIREQGRRIAYDPRCTVFHKESATTGQQSPLRSYCLTRNRLLFAWRNLRGGARLLSVAYQLCIAAPKNAVSALAHRRGDLAKAVCRGVRDFFTLKNKQA